MLFLNKICRATSWQLWVGVCKHMECNDKRNVMLTESWTLEVSLKLLPLINGYLGQRPAESFNFDTKSLRDFSEIVLVLTKIQIQISH